MKLIVRNNKILATHLDSQDVVHLYPEGSIAYILPDGYGKFTPADSLTDKVDLTTAKTIQRKYLEDKMNIIRRKGFTSTGGIKLQCTDTDVNSLVNAKSLAVLRNALSITIRDYNNATHTLPIPEFDSLMGELGSYVTGLLNTLWDKKDDIDKADTVLDVFAIGL